MILIAYDGSADADAAIDRAGALFGGQEAVVLTVWEGIVEVLTRSGSGFAAANIDYEGIDRASEAHAHEQAHAGAERAERAGLKAQPRVCAREGSVSDTILAQADGLGADAIVMGTRGLTGLKSVLLGSVSHGVLQRADRPVVVVPSPG